MRWLERAAAGMAVLSGFCFIGLALLICIDVANRNLKLISLPWTVNVAEYLLYAMTFLGAPWVLMQGGHIVVDLLIRTVRPEWERVIGRLADIAALLVNGILLVYALRALHASYAAGTVVYKALVFPEWYLYVLAVVTFALLTLIYLVWVISPDRQAPGRRAGVH